MAHFLSPPFDLPEGRDARLLRYLRDDDWLAATTLLRDVVTPETTRWQWLVLLAYVRFRDASEVLVNELGDACREALVLLDRAMTHGAAIDDVAPLRKEVEDTLDRVSREEEAMLDRIGPGDDMADLSDEEVDFVASSLVKDAERSARLHEVIAARHTGAKADLHKGIAALLRAKAGGFELQRPALEALLAQPWTTEPFIQEPVVMEDLAVTLLEHLEGADFERVFTAATKHGEQLDFDFPSVQPHQDRLLPRLLALGQHARARALATRMENERDEFPRALDELMKLARAERV